MRHKKSLSENVAVSAAVTAFCLVVLGASLTAFFAPATHSATKCVLDASRECTQCTKCKPKSNCCCLHVDECPCDVPTTEGGE